MINSVAFNPCNAPPSYKEFGKGKPKRQKEVFPIRLIVCSKCKRGGGTLVKIGDKYNHETCSG